jgi:hypothetical protein
MAARQVQVVLPFSEDKDKARTKKIIHTVRGLPFVYGLAIFEGKREKLVVFRVTPKATGKCFYALQSLGVRPLLLLSLSLFYSCSLFE